MSDSKISIVPKSDLELFVGEKLVGKLSSLTIDLEDKNKNILFSMPKIELEILVYEKAFENIPKVYTLVQQLVAKSKFLRLAIVK